MAETIKIGGELESTATGNKVADVANIKDKTKGNKSQAQINAELETALEERYTKSETYNKTQLDNMITTPEIAYKDYDTYTAMLAETNHPAGAIYRVANYDGTQAVTNKYAEYSWDGTQYKLMAVRDYGIDDTPTSGSNNLVTSGSIYEFVHSLTTETVNVDTLPEPSEDTIHKIYCTPVSNSTPLNTKNEFITIYEEIVPDYTNVDGLLTLANVPTDEDGAQIGDGTFIVNVTSTNKAYYVTIVRNQSEYGYTVTSVICEVGKLAKLRTNELYVSNGTIWVVQPNDRIYKWESLSPDMSNYYTKAETTALVGAVQVETIAEAGVYDVSAKNPTAGPNNDGKFTLEYILNQNNVDTLIPTAVRKGGMSIKFVQSSDNKYVQYRLMADAFTTDVAQWQGVDDEPIAGSENLVKSGGVFGVMNESNYTTDKYVSASGNSAPYTVEEVSAQGYIINNVKIAIAANTPIRWYSGFTRDDTITPKRQLLRLNGDDECIDYANYYDEYGNGYQVVAGSGVAYYILASFYINGSTPCKITNSDGTVVLWEPKATSIKERIGDISELETSVKTNLVAAINYIEETKNTPASQSSYNGTVDANNVKDAIDKVGEDIEDINSLIDSYSEEGNCISGKYLTWSNNSATEVANDNFFINKVAIPVSGEFRWYAGQDTAFSENPKPQVIIYVNGELFTYYNYYASSTDEHGDVYSRITNNRTATIIASFRKGGTCKITDNNGNVLWEPVNDTTVKYISSQEVRDPLTKEAIQHQVDTIKEAIEDLSGNNCIDGNETKLFIGNIVSGSPAVNATITPSSTVVCMETLTAVPFMYATLKFNLPLGIVAGIRSGNCGAGRDTSQVNLTENIQDGDTFTFGDDDMLFRLFFRHSDNSDITSTEVNNYITNGDLYVTFNESCPILSAQADCDKYSKALMYKYHLAYSDSGKNYLGNIPVFAHISDIHGDSTRLERFMQYCDSLPLVAALNTGDSCAQNFSNGLNFVEEIAALHKTLLYTCVGNHDTYGNATEQGQFQNIMSYQDDERYGIEWSNETYPTSFYKDFDGAKIRLIALNQWTAGAGISPYIENMSQAQINMLVSALENCPEDYGVIIMSHNPEGSNTVTKVQGYEKFFQDPNYGSAGTVMTNVITEQQPTNIATYPITDIVDAYIRKTTLNKQYVANTNPQVTLTVNADFSNSEGEFIFWATGHNHQDFIGYSSVATERQLIMEIACANAIYGRGVSDNETCQDGDLPRGGQGATQDCFNLYAIDRDNGVVKIARIGSNRNYKMELRDYMSIPYKV